MNLTSPPPNCASGITCVPIHVVRGTSLRIYPGGMTPPPRSPQQLAAGQVQNRRSRSVRNSFRFALLRLHLPPPVGRRIPGTDGPVMEARSSSVVHRVKQGETLWSIARAYQTTVEAIQAGNRYLFSRPLQVGDTLTILPPR